MANRQSCVNLIYMLLQTKDRIADYTKVRADIEQIMLYVVKPLNENRIFYQTNKQPQMCIQFINSTNSLYLHIILVCASAIYQRGLSVITFSSINLHEW